MHLKDTGRLKGDNRWQAAWKGARLIAGNLLQDRVGTAGLEKSPKLTHVVENLNF